MIASPPPSPPLVLQRARGRAEVGFVFRDAATRLERLFQEGQAKIRVPKSGRGEAPTAVLINTAGGIAGGDRIGWGVAVGAGARAVATSQAAERVYRSSTTDGGLSGAIETRLAVGPGGHLDWLPQETILFDRSALDRTLAVELAEGATAVMVETVVFGRLAMGERVEHCRLVDRWRVRRGGRLVFADTFRVEGAAEAILAGRATGGGARAFATVLVVEPGVEARVEAVREVLAAAPAAGASAFDGLLVARLADADPARLRSDLGRLLVHIRRADLPRVWSC
jgi:urease accessory protein